MKKIQIKNKEYLFIALISILFYWALNNINLFITTINYVLAMLSPFIIGGCIGFILNILVSAIEKKILIKGKNKIYMKSRRAISTLLSIIILLGSITLVLFYILPEVFNSLQEVAQNIPYTIERIEKETQKLAENNKFFNDIMQNLNLDFNDLSGKAITFFKQRLPKALEITFNITTSIFTTFFNLLIALIFGIYIVLQKEKLERYMDLTLVAYTKPSFVSKFNKITKLTYDSFSSFITGQLVERTILGVLCFIGMELFKIPQSVLISFIIAIIGIIPMIGGFIGAAIGVVLIFITAPAKVLVFIVFITILLQIDGNVIYPRVIGDSMGIPSIVVLVSFILAGKLFGMVGMILSVPIASILFVLYKESLDKIIDKKDIKL